MRVLVSGASGYLATNLIRALSSVDCQIVRLSRKPMGLSFPEGSAHMVDIEGDITRREVWDQALDGVEVAFHLAGQTSVPVAAADPEADFRHNVLPMLLLLESCRQQSRCPVVVFAGTSTQVGLPARLPVDESIPDNPVTIYDLHKLAAERYLKHYISQGFVRGTSLRLANVYGPGPKSSSADRGILNAMIRRGLDGHPLTVYGTGGFLRDYVYVDDVVRAFLLAAICPGAINGRHFVLGSGKGYTLADAFNLIAQRTSLKTHRTVAVHHIPAPASLGIIEQRNFVADIREFRQATGWAPDYDLPDGIDSTIEAWS